MMPAASFPPLQKAQERGTQSLETGKEKPQSQGHPPSKAKNSALLLMVQIMLLGAAFSQIPTNESARMHDLRRCLGQQSCRDAREAAYQLAKRKDFSFLLNKYEGSGEVLRSYIVEGIYGAGLGHDDSKVIRFMERVAFRGKSADRLSDTTWYALQFLAQSCDERALQSLNAYGGNEQNVYGYHVACSDWAKSLEAFGKCKYASARYVLLNSLNSSCLDVVQTAGDSLQLLYPGQCKKARTFPEEKHCYVELWGATLGAASERSGPSAQTHFSADDHTVKNPVPIPGSVLGVLRGDEAVRTALANERISAENLPLSWFSASAIHLSKSKNLDLVVMGEGSLRGSNVTTFWVFCTTPSGYKLILAAPAHDLVIRNTHCRGYRDIELTSMTAVQVSKVLLRFNGERYVKHTATSQPLQ